MVDERYQLTLSLQVLKEERQKMLSDFSDRIDPDMGTGLLHYNSIKTANMNYMQNFTTSSGSMNTGTESKNILIRISLWNLTAEKF